jgi:hypothetical protein
MLAITVIALDPDLFENYRVSTGKAKYPYEKPGHQQNATYEI